MVKRVNFERLAAKIFCICTLSVILWAVLKYFGGMLIALSAALSLSFFINRCAAWLQRALRLPKRLCAALLFFSVVSTGATAAVLLILRLYGELEGAVCRIAESKTQIIFTLTRVLSFFEGAGERLGLLGKEGALSAHISSLMSSLPNHVLSAALGGVGRLLSGLSDIAPRTVLSVLLFFIATAYLSVDGDRVKRAAAAVIPKRYMSAVKGMIHGLIGGALQYIKAYVILFLMTLFELYVGFLILRIPYPLLISLAVAAVDILPLFGAGIVLLPWAAVSFVLGNYSVGTGLLILYGVVLVVRQVAEPYIIGEKMGFHPLLLLILTIICFFLFGAVGALLSPFVAIFIREAVKYYREQ